MYFFFDYIYYRITAFFFKNDGRTGVTAIVFIALSQTFILWLILADPILDYYLTVDESDRYSKNIGYVGGAIFLILFFLNYRKYNGKYNQYRFCWKGESENRKFLKGILVFISMLLPFILFAIVKH